MKIQSKPLIYRRSTDWLPLWKKDCPYLKIKTTWRVHFHFAPWNEQEAIFLNKTVIEFLEEVKKVVFRRQVTSFYGYCCRKENCYCMNLHEGPDSYRFYFPYPYLSPILPPTPNFVPKSREQYERTMSEWFYDTILGFRNFFL